MIRLLFFAIKAPTASMRIRSGFFAACASLVLLSGCTQQVPRSSQFSAPVGSSADLKLTQHGELDARYRIQAGDRILLNFMNYESQDREFLVRPDGWCSLPLVDDFKISGATMDDAKEQLQKHYEIVLREPRLKLSLVYAMPQYIYVGGEMRLGGQKVEYNQGMTVEQAIVAAGGVDKRGEMRNVFVVRDQGQGEPEYLVYNLWDEQTKGYTPYYLQPKDIVMVPSSRVANASRFVEQYLNELIPFSKSMSVSYQFNNDSRNY